MLTQTTLLRALKGAPISIVVALLIQPANRSHGPQSLAALTGYDRGTVSNALVALAEMDLVQNHGRYRGWSLTTLSRQLLLPVATLEDPHSDVQLTLTDVDSKLHHTAANCHTLSETCTPSPLTVPPAPTREGEFHSIEGEPLPRPPPPTQNGNIEGAIPPLPSREVVSSSKPTPTLVVSTTTTTTTQPDTLRLLRDVGVFHPLAVSIATDPWCTAARTSAWISNIRSQMATPSHSVRSLPALLAANLQSHRPPPPAPPAHNHDSWSRFTDDPYHVYDNPQD